MRSLIKRITGITASIGTLLAQGMTALATQEPYSDINKVLNTSADVKSLGTTAYSLISTILKYAGAISVLVGFVTVGILMVIKRNSPDGRSSAMSGLLWVAIGAIIIGGAAVLGGMFFGIGHNLK